MHILENLYELEIKKISFIDRKIYINKTDVFLQGVSKSGKTSLIFQYLQDFNAKSYLYLDLKDERIDINDLEQNLQIFIDENKIQILAIDNYNPTLKLPEVEQCILSAEQNFCPDGFELKHVFPLDFEEFIAFDSKFDSPSAAFTRFLKFGSFTPMVNIAKPFRDRSIQAFLKTALSELAFDIIKLASKYQGQKLSAFMLFNQLKKNRKISKDQFYKTFAQLQEMQYLFLLEKYGSAKSAKKLYLIDFNLKYLFTFHKDFVKLFENLIFLDLTRRGHQLFYEEQVDFYLADTNEIVLVHPFATEAGIKKHLEKIKSFIKEHAILKIQVVTMNNEFEFETPEYFCECSPYTTWTIVDED